MSKHAIATSAALLLSATPVLADLSAQDVWTDWQQVYGAMGLPLTADASYADGTLTLDAVTMTTDLGGVASSTSYGSLSLTEQADGTVRINLPASMTMTTVTTIEGETLEQSIQFDQEGWTGVITQDGETRIYDFTADSLAYIFDDLVPDQGDATVGGRATLTNLVSRYVNTTSGDTLTTDQTVTADGMVLTMAADGPDSFDLSYDLGAITSEGTGTVDLANISTTSSLSDLGAVFSGDIQHSGSTLALTAMSEDGPFTLNGTSTSGRIGFDLNADTLGYEISSKGAEMAVQVSAFPLPVNLSMSELTTAIAMPMGVSETPKPFALSLAYRDLALDDALWGLFDPTGQLPRDPATLLLDLSGTAVMNIDLFGGDPEALAGLQGAPGEVKTLDLTQLRLALAGAELTGDGAVTFPSPGPLPMPVGKVNLGLTGGLGLLDKLVALGFVPQEQAAFIKGMSGVVAKPVGEDELVSEIEFTEGGGITANGLPLQ